MAFAQPAPPDLTLIAGPIESPLPRLAVELKDFARMIDCDLSTCYRHALAGHLVIRKLGRKSIVLMDEAHDFLKALPKGADPEATAAALASRQAGGAA